MAGLLLIPVVALLFSSTLTTCTSSSGSHDRDNVQQQTHGDAEMIEEFPMTAIRLTNGSSFMQAAQLNLEYLLMLDPDQLLYSFRVTANLSTQGAKPYGGWEAPNIELRGHFVGHYLSATAMMYASTGNSAVRWMACTCT